MAFAARTAALASAVALAVTAPATPPHQARPAGPAGSGWASEWQQRGHAMTPSCLVAGAAKVTVIGDSVTRQMTVRLSGQLGLAHLTNCVETWSARPSMPAVAAAAALPVMARSSVLVMATGTNDVFDPGQLPDAIDAALRLAHGRPVVWVNVYVHRAGTVPALRAYDLPNSRVVNAMLAAAAGRHPSLHVVDWYAVAAAHPALLLKDGVHVTDRGSRVRTAMIVAAVRRALA
ncbi:MAG TPA: hypothetical protein VFL59_06040 [Candidatus Nanopelagicales bacterium]|nr:hypothetical protein [Candidatus Nanopelagicales bacterium]